LHRRQRVRSSDTRDAFVEPRPGRKKISRKLITRQIPSSPASSRPPPSPRVSIIAHPASSTRHRLRAATFGFRSLHVELQLLADRQVVSGVVAESSRCRLGWQFYINKSTARYTAHEAEPRGSGKPTPYHPATRTSHSLQFTLSFIASIIVVAATHFQTCCKPSVSNHCPAV
jgi:hypothetical protein